MLLNFPFASTGIESGGSIAVFSLGCMDLKRDLPQNREERGTHSFYDPDSRFEAVASQVYANQRLSKRISAFWQSSGNRTCATCKIGGPRDNDFDIPPGNGP